MEQKRCLGCMQMKTDTPVCEHCGYDENISNEQHQIPAGMVLKEQYLIGKVLGQGGFGITYLGWDLYLDIPVAIKEYFPSGTVMRETSVSMDVVSYSGDVGVRFRNNKERFMREAKMLARFSQVPEIVQIKNFFLANNTTYIVMEYVKGITLKQYVKESGGRLPVEATFELMKPVIQALCKVHKAGLVHRDISPDNIMMLPEGCMKLLDFGAVRDVGDASVDKQLTKSTEAILKQGYAPIEQYQNRGSLGPWTDVYALCATIYYCLTGEVPPDAPERLLGEDEIDFKGEIPELSDYQADVLKEGMALRTQERIASMEELYQRLYEGLDGKEEINQTEVGEGEPAKEEASDVFRETEQASDSSEENEGQVKALSKKDTEEAKEKVKKAALGGLTAVSAMLALVIIVVTLFPSNALEQGKNHTGQKEGTEFSEENQQESFEEQEKEVVSEEENQEIDEELAKEIERMPVVSGQCGDSISWELDRRTGTLTLTGEGEMYDFNGGWQEEKEEEGYNPEREYQPWFDYKQEILTLKLSDGITVIGENAFECCNNLQNIEWGSGLREIRFQAFLATAVKELKFPESLVIIRNCAFNWCENLYRIELPKSLERVEDWAFNACGKLRTVIFFAANTEIETSISDFQGRVSTPFTHEDTGEHSEDLVIWGYENSTAEEFAEGYGLRFVNLYYDDKETTGQCGDTITWRMDLEEKTLYLEGIGETWLYYTNTEDFGLLVDSGYPSTWLRYGKPSWYIYHNDIERIVIGEGITHLNTFLFDNLPVLKEIDFGTVQSANNAFHNCSIEEVILPESLTFVGDYLFGGCHELRKATILNGSDGVGHGVFENCMQLEEIHFSKEAVITGDILNAEGGAISNKLTFYVYEGSSAMQYAVDYNIPYEIRED